MNLISTNGREYPIDLEHIDADLAEQYLLCNTHNRTPRQAKIKEYAGYLRSGTFVFNGDPIRFDENGVLLDGQHRLHAIKETGIGAEVLVIRNLPADVMSTIDQGAPRSAIDIVRLRNGSIGDLNAVSGIARVSLVYRGELVKANSKQAVADEIEADADHYMACARISRQFNGHIKGSVALVGLAVSIIAEAGNDFDDIAEFTHAVALGEGLYRGEAGYALRDYLLKNPLNISGTRSVTTMRTELFPIIRAWNAHVTEEPLRLIRKLGPNQRFPDPVKYVNPTRQKADA